MSEAAGSSRRSARDEIAQKGAQREQRRTAGDLGAEHRKMRRREKAKARRERKENTRRKLSSLTSEDAREANGPAKLKGPERKLQKMLEKSQQLEIRGQQLLAKSKKFAARYQSLLAQTKPQGDAQSKIATENALDLDNWKSSEKSSDPDTVQSSPTGGGSDDVNGHESVVKPCQDQESTSVSNPSCVSVSKASGTKEDYATNDQSREKTGKESREKDGTSREKTKSRMASQQDAVRKLVDPAIALSQSKEGSRMLSSSSALAINPSTTTHSTSKNHRKRKAAAGGTENDDMDVTEAQRSQREPDRVDRDKQERTNSSHGKEKEEKKMRIECEGEEAEQRGEKADRKSAKKGKSKEPTTKRGRTNSDKKGSDIGTLTTTAEKWHVDELAGGPARQEKYLRLLGGQRKGVEAALSKAERRKATTSSSSTKAEAEILRQFEEGMKAKLDMDGKRKGLGS